MWLWAPARLWLTTTSQSFKLRRAAGAACRIRYLILSRAFAYVMVDIDNSAHMIADHFELVDDV